MFSSAFVLVCYVTSFSDPPPPLFPHFTGFYPARFGEHAMKGTTIAHSSDIDNETTFVFPSLDSVCFSSEHLPSSLLILDVLSNVLQGKWQLFGHPSRLISRSLSLHSTAYLSALERDPDLPDDLLDSIGIVKSGTYFGDGITHDVKRRLSLSFFSF
jgi:hypothetical protein